MTTITRHLVCARLNPLAVATTRTDRIRQRKNPSQSFDHPRLAAHDRPTLGRMIADLEAATVHRHIVPVDVEHDAVAGRGPHDRIPGTAAQRMRAAENNTRHHFDL